MKASVAAALVLREAGIPSVCGIDHAVLHKIAKRGSMRCRGNGSKTVLAVLNALSRAPGELVPGYLCTGPRILRIFYLPEHTTAEKARWRWVRRVRALAAAKARKRR